MLGACGGLDEWRGNTSVQQVIGVARTSIPYYVKQSLDLAETAVAAYKPLKRRPAH